MNIQPSIEPTPDCQLTISAQKSSIEVVGILPFDLADFHVSSLPEEGKVKCSKNRTSLFRSPFHLRSPKIANRLKQHAEQFPQTVTITPNAGLLRLLRDELEDRGIDCRFDTPMWQPHIFHIADSTTSALARFVASNNFGEVVMCKNMKLAQVVRDIASNFPAAKIAIVTATRLQATKIFRSIRNTAGIANSDWNRATTPHPKIVVGACRTLDRDRELDLHSINLFLVTDPESFMTIQLRELLGDGTGARRVFFVRHASERIRLRDYYKIVQVVGVGTIAIDEDGRCRKKVNVSRKKVSWILRGKACSDEKDLVNAVETSRKRNRAVKEIAVRKQRSHGANVIVVAARKSHALAIANLLTPAHCVIALDSNISNCQDWLTNPHRIMVCTTQSLAQIPSPTGNLVMIWAGARYLPPELPEHLCWADASYVGSVEVLDVCDNLLDPPSGAETQTDFAPGRVLRDWGLSRQRRYEDLNWGATDEAFRSKLLRKRLLLKRPAVLSTPIIHGERS